MLKIPMCTDTISIVFVIYVFGPRTLNTFKFVPFFLYFSLFKPAEKNSME